MNSTDEARILFAGKIRNLMAVYRKNEDLINIGAYIKGSNPECDEAIKFIDKINAFLKQSTTDKCVFEDTIEQLEHLLG